MWANFAVRRYDKIPIPPNFFSSFLRFSSLLSFEAAFGSQLFRIFCIFVAENMQYELLAGSIYSYNRNPPNLQRSPYPCTVSSISYLFLPHPPSFSPRPRPFGAEIVAAELQKNATPKFVYIKYYRYLCTRKAPKQDVTRRFTDKIGRNQPQLPVALTTSATH